MPTPLVFISYSHKDVAWYGLVETYLRAGEQRGFYQLFGDPKMRAGADWDAHLKERLAECAVFILLASEHSLTSDYILNTELATVRARGNGVHICPLLVEPVTDPAFAHIKDKNVKPPDKQALSGFNEHDRREQLVNFARDIEALACAPATPSVPPAAPKKFARPKLIHLHRLPESGYKRLVGRETELATLDAAWADPNVNILSVVAEGGAGKTALVAEWLMRMQRENYRGAQTVLGWSFYSQGSHERATSSDTFLNWALEKLEIKAPSEDAFSKAEKIAEEMGKHRILLVLDGVEPLQYGPGMQAGEWKDRPLGRLLSRFAAEPPAGGHGLILLSSRVEVVSLRNRKASSAPMIDLASLSDEAGAQLLSDNGATVGTDKDRREASHAFGGHPLALTLLGNYVRETQGGDIRRRKNMRGVLSNVQNKGHDHAKRVMESIEKEWLADKPLLLAIMFLVGLFDRPADAGCLLALRAKPVIRGLTKPIVALSEAAWNQAVAQLREVKLLLPVDPADREALDAHPLTREAFGEQLRETNAAAWKAAHGRLYEHLRDTTKEGDEPTLEALTPLYHAIAHGCRAGRYQEALHVVYWNRLCRKGQDGQLIFHASKKLGAFGSDLAAISWFFEPPFEAPVTILREADKSWVLSVAGFNLRAQGRLSEAVRAVQAGQHADKQRSDWRNAARDGANLSEVENGLGHISAAQAAGEQAVAYGERSADNFATLYCQTALADARAAAARWAEAEALFADAEARQRANQPQLPRLYSLQGFRYCDLLLARGAFAEARERAVQTLDWMRRYGKSRLDVALDTLTLGRVALGLALSAPAHVPEEARAAACRLDEAVAALHGAGQLDYVPRGYLARAALRRSLGDWAGAARDLDEVEEIAEPGPFRLFLADLALERARLALWRRAGFAPLAGFADPPRAPAPEAEVQAAASLAEAKRQLVGARKLITECGYHKRDEELAELEAVVAGSKRPEDLPPRV